MCILETRLHKTLRELKEQGLPYKHLYFLSEIVMVQKNLAEYPIQVKGNGK